MTQPVRTHMKPSQVEALFVHAKNAGKTGGRAASTDAACF